MSCESPYRSTSANILHSVCVCVCVDKDVHIQDERGQRIVLQYLSVGSPSHYLPLITLQAEDNRLELLHSECENKCTLKLHET